MKIYTKASLIQALREIRDMGWIPTGRPGNDGGIGNTLEDLLEIKENNLPLPNASEWELKAQRANTSSLITLFHMEPSPRTFRFVPQVFLPNYGWVHQLAGIKYPATEMSFRQTIHGRARSDRGFTVMIDRSTRRVLVSFDSNAVASHHAEWLRSLEEKVGIGELDPQPYWGFDDLHHKAATKLPNSFYVTAEVKKESGTEYFKYTRISILEQFSFDSFLLALENADLLVDFDARTGHNHGTKFRLRKDKLPTLYGKVVDIS